VIEEYVKYDGMKLVEGRDFKQLASDTARLLIVKLRHLLTSFAGKVAPNKPVFRFHT